MTDTAHSSIRFVLNGKSYVLTRDQVDRRLAGVAPEEIRKHAVRINDTWYPAVQAFEVAVDVPRSSFISHTARRHLAALGYEVHGDVEHRPAEQRPTPTTSTPRTSAPARSAKRPAAADETWHTEANVQAAVVASLVARGWRIQAVADTASRQHGIDIVAVRGDDTVGVEVKGFPSRTYADPARAGELKPTSPSTQAGHWYAQAVLAAMRLRGKRPSLRSVIALPDFPRYRDLHADTQSSLTAANIEVWWVNAEGAVHSN